MFHRSAAFRAVRVVLVVPVVVSALGAARASAAPPDDTAAVVLDAVSVRGQRSADKTSLGTDPTALPGSTTRVTQDEIARQAVQSYGDLLRPVTGLNINSFGVGGLGYGLSLRGFVDTEHGKDIAVFVDGVPANVSSAVQANGYIDLNPLLPETIASFDVIRGPLAVQSGNHALGGTILFRTIDAVPRNVVDVSGGSWGTGRALALVGLKGPGFTGYSALEAYTTDGYRGNNGDQRIDSFTKIAFPLASGTASLRLQVYGDTYGEPGYLNRAAVESGAVAATARISPTDHGLSQQQNLVFNYAGSRDDDTSATAYVVHRKLFRTRTTGGNGLPDLGTLQRASLDDRVSFGGSVQRTASLQVLDTPTLLLAGASVYSDVIEATRFNTDLRGNRTTQNQDRDLDVYNPALFAEAQVRPVAPLKLTAGARYDRFYNTIKTGPSDSLPNLDTSPRNGRFSPRVGAAYALVDGISLYGNVTRGVKAPSAYDELPFNPRLAVSKIRGSEVGVQAQDATGRWRAVFDVWRTDQSGEVQNDPVTGDLVNFGRTRRQGFDVEGRLRVLGDARGDLTVFANYSRVSARTFGGGSGDLYVTTVPKYTATLGIDASAVLATERATHRFGFYAYDTFVGAKHLDAAGTIDSHPYQRVSLKATYANSGWKGITPYLAATIYPTGRLDETTFFSGGVVVTAPKAPVTATGGVSIAFD